MSDDKSICVQDVSMDAVYVALAAVLHRRLTRNYDVSDAVWNSRGHWHGHFCGQSCPCCRSAVGEIFGSCDACDAVNVSLVIARRIASFARGAQCKREVMACLTGSFSQGRHLPQSLLLAIGDFLPKHEGVPHRQGWQVSRCTS